jgi:hypothetical protein
MRISNSQCVLDRTPVLFGSARNLTRISDHAVGIAAVDTIERFELVEVSQVLSIEDDVFGSWNERKFEIRGSKSAGTP